MSKKWKRRYEALRLQQTELRLQQTEAALDVPIRLRNVTIGWEERTVTIGRSRIQAGELPYLTFPILTTDRVLMPDGLHEVLAGDEVVA